MGGRHRPQRTRCLTPDSENERQVSHFAGFLLLQCHSGQGARHVRALPEAAELQRAAGLSQRQRNRRVSENPHLLCHRAAGNQRGNHPPRIPGNAAAPQAVRRLRVAEPLRHDGRLTSVRLPARTRRDRPDRAVPAAAGRRTAGRIFLFDAAIFLFPHPAQPDRHEQGQNLWPAARRTGRHAVPRDFGAVHSQNG